MGLDRIKKNLKLDNHDIIEYIKNIIKNKDTITYKKGKNYYCETDNLIITINSYSYTIITAHTKKKEWKKNAQGSVSTGGTDGKCVL